MSNIGYFDLFKAFEYIHNNIDGLSPGAEIDAHSPQSQIEEHWYLQNFQVQTREAEKCPLSRPPCTKQKLSLSTGVQGIIRIRGPDIR